MKPFKVSMLKDEGRELYGQGETLLEAIAMLVRAIDEYGDASDKVSMMEATDDLNNGMPPRSLLLGRQLDDLGRCDPDGNAS